MTATRTADTIRTETRTDATSTCGAARQRRSTGSTRQPVTPGRSSRGATSAPLDREHLAELLVAARQGCRRSMQEIIQLCEPHVRRQALGRAWRADHVDDIVQEVWLQLLQHADRIREPLSLLAWLTAVTRHAALHAGVRASKTVAKDLDDTPSDEPSTEDAVVERCSRRQVGPVVRRALDRLDAPDRTLLELLNRSDRPCYREIGRQVGRPVGSLGPTRQRLLQRLRHDDEIAQLASLVTVA